MGVGIVRHEYRFWFKNGPKYTPTLLFAYKCEGIFIPIRDGRQSLRP